MEKLKQLWHAWKLRNVRRSTKNHYVSDPRFHEGVTLTFHTVERLTVADVCELISLKKVIAMGISEHLSDIIRSQSIWDELKNAGVTCGLFVDPRLKRGQWYLITLDAFVESSSTMFKDILNQANNTNYGSENEQCGAGNQD